MHFYMFVIIIIWYGVNMIKLREWQARELATIATPATNRILVSAPTGSGKAFFLMMIAKNYITDNKRVLLLVDRIALVDQLSESANLLGLSHNVIQGDNRIDNNSLFTISSLQTYFNTPDFQPDLILLDEAHTLYSNVTNYAKSFSGLVIGATATPFTIGLDEHYNQLINATTTLKLIEEGHLVPIKPLIMTKIDMQGAATVGGEWTGSEIEQRSATILGDAPSSYLQYAAGKRAICFCATIQHCIDTATEFIAAGIAVGVYTSKTCKEQRKMLLKQFDNSEIMILISVSALSKGFDKPYVECILDLRPLRRSFAEYVQILGRGMRSFKDKTHCILLDFSGNYKRFAPDLEQFYRYGVDKLDNAEHLNRVRKDSAEDLTTVCPECGNKHFVLECLGCGHVDEILINMRKNKTTLTTDKVNIIAIEIAPITEGVPPTTKKPVIRDFRATEPPTIFNKIINFFTGASR